jgi:hypothetical protein
MRAGVDDTLDGATTHLHGRLRGGDNVGVNFVGAETACLVDDVGGE